MALPLRRQTWSFHTIEAKQEVLDSLHLHRSESSLRSTIEPLPSFTLTPAPPTLSPTSSLGHVGASPPALSALDSPIASSGLPNPCGLKGNAASLKLLPRPLAVHQPVKFGDRTSYPLSVLPACPPSDKRRVGLAISSRQADEELKDIEEDEGASFTIQDGRQMESGKAVPVMEKEEKDSLDDFKGSPIRKAEMSKEVQTGGGLEERAETLPTAPIVVDKKEEEKVIETEHFKIFPSQEAFEEYARGRITAVHPKVTLELKRSPHTVTISCRNRRKEYTSCEFLLRGREDFGPDGFNGKYKLAKGGEDEVIGHNAACLARLNGGKASQTASKAASPAVSPPKDVQIAQPPSTMPLSSAKVVNQPKLAARSTTEPGPPIQIKPQTAETPALHIHIPPPTIIKAREVRKKRVIVIEPESDEELSDLEQEEYNGDADKRVEQKGLFSPANANVEEEDDSGESTEEEDFETPAQLRKRKAAHPGNVLPSRARRYRPAYYGL